MLSDSEYKKKYDVTKTEARRIVKLNQNNNNSVEKTVSSYLKGMYVKQGIDPKDHQRHAERKSILKDQSLTYEEFLYHAEQGTLDQVMDASAASYMNFEVGLEDDVKSLSFTFRADITRMYDLAGISNKKS